MKVVLLETVGNLGITGDIVNVKPGYARNFLIPQNKAAVANTNSVREITHQKMILEHKLKTAKKSAEEAKKLLEKEVFTVQRKTADGDKLFGSVTALDIENVAKEKGYNISRRAISLETPIKKLGAYKVSVKLDGDLTVQLSLEVQAEPA
ncbi:MAG: 50S ribosomal protein L9 [Bdellovibrionales bacterium]|nr:50S ribosomal protein L9 [Bdellovibrionales bacterium]